MKVGDLVKHIDKKHFGVVAKLLKLRDRNREIWVFWPDGEIKKYQTDYYLEVVCK